VDAYATGYYFIPRGDTTDPVTGNQAQQSTINAKFRIANVSDYLLAIPGGPAGPLHIAYGTNATGGILYAQDITFDKNTTIPTTRVGTVYYYGTVLPTDLSFVQFTGPTPQKLSYRPSFAVLDPTMRAIYSSASGNLPAPALNGLVGAPTSHVYYIDGDAQIAQGQPLTVQGVYVIYATGSAYIHNAITPADSNSWVAVLAEQNIDITNDAPSQLTLNGTFVCNGSFLADPLAGNQPHTPPDSLAIVGGIVSLGSIAVSNYYPTSRSYTYKSSSDPNLILPNLSTLLQYKILGSGGGS